MRPLHEAYLLLAHDARGALPWRRSMQAWYGLAGAIVEELAEWGRIRLARRVEVVDGTPTGDPALDAALRVLGARRARSLESWIVWLPHHADDLRRATGDALAAQGVVAREEARVLGLARIRYPVLDATAVPALRDDARRALFAGAPDARAIRLAALLHASGQLDALFPERRERRQAEAALRARGRDDPEGRDVAAAVRGVIMGMMSATIG